MKITIEEIDNKLTISTEGVTYDAAILMLGSAMHNISVTTIDTIVKATAEEERKNKHPFGKKQKEAAKTSISEDIADRLNFLFSNILEDICPKDPSLELSEVAIATLENEIIDYAYRNKLDMQTALKQYQDNLVHSSIYSAEKDKSDETR